MSIFGTALLAAYSIDSWRREYRAKKQSELAEETLTLFYEVQDIIPVIRSFGGFEGEGTTRTVRPGETDEQREARNRAYVLIERYQKHRELLSKIHSMRYRFMAQFGKDAAKPFDDLHRLLRDLLSSARRLADLWTTDLNAYSHEQRERHFQRREQWESIFWEESGDDEINRRLQSIIEEIEKTCRNVITAKGTIFSFLNYPLEFIAKRFRKS
jgi:hypothetical protein